MSENLGDYGRSLEAAIRAEDKAHARQSRVATKRRLLLTNLHRLDLGAQRQWRRRLLVRALKKYGLSASIASHGVLREAYHAACEIGLCRQRAASAKNGGEAAKTRAEAWFRRSFQQVYPKRELHWSLIIGTRVVDFFSPSFQGSGYRGIVFEIDGICHDRETKSKKDDSGEVTLKALKIVVARICNEKAFSGETLAHLGKMNEGRKPDSRRRLSLWAQIYIETVACQADEAFMLRHFGMDEGMAEKILRVISARRREKGNGKHPAKPRASRKRSQETNVEDRNESKFKETNEPVILLRKAAKNGEFHV